MLGHVRRSEQDAACVKRERAGEDGGAELDGRLEDVRSFAEASGLGRNIFVARDQFLKSDPSVSSPTTAFGLEEQR